MSFTPEISADHWVFGYGSLIYKVDFPYRERQVATLQDWVRRFWQGSHDHRGTPAAPGRVVTLTEAPGATCTGMAYRIDATVFDHLDHREKNGYRRIDAPLQLADGRSVDATVYIATADNPAFLGSAPAAELASHIATSHGPSGSNLDYFQRLVAALDALGVREPHLEEIGSHLPR